MNRQCAWCGNVWSDGKWVPVSSEPEGDVTHGMCPGCHRKTLRRLRE
ncbi:MAG: hypothetical protein ACLFVU_12175 [Phycisphaerae bacterium]